MRPARAAIDVERERLELAERTAGEREGALRSERADLAAERDPKPADPPWLSPGRLGEPLWRCVDFTDELAGDGRAGLEGALMASGLLGAVIQPDGTLRAADGELLLSPASVASPRPGRALSVALRPDAAARLPAETIAAVLDSIGFGDRTFGTTVSADGSLAERPVARAAHHRPGPAHRGGRPGRAPPGADRADRRRTGRAGAGSRGAGGAAG